MPNLYVLAGPNGSGKSTFYYNALKDGQIQKELSFINADIIVRDELGKYTEENYTKAADIVRHRMKLAINDFSDFMIESNLATDAEYRWIENLQNAKGYRVVLYFLFTDDVDINIARVFRRVAEGGHSVPEAIIRHRYQLGLSYLKTHIHLFDEAFLIDNSTETPVVMATLKFGLVSFKANNPPTLVNEVLYITEKLKRSG